MFRLWFMTFAGTPRDHHRYDHAHESPRVMTGPLIVLAVMAVGVAWPIGALSVNNLLHQAQPVGTAEGGAGVLLSTLTVPAEHLSHAPAIKQVAGLSAFGAAISGVLLAAIIYLWRRLDAREIQQTFRPIYNLLWGKWFFDELYDAVFIRPTLAISRQVARFDRSVIDGVIHACAAIGRGLSKVFDVLFDRTVVDGTVNTFANWTWDFGLLLRRLQTGSLRQYVLFIVMGTWFVCLAYFAVSFVLLS
jgi:NADH-quinone oxidoreductase subunit L